MSEQALATPAPLEAAESAWMHALFLHERRAPDPASLPAAALDAAAERARSWRGATGVDEETFRHRLASAGMDWDDFVRILAARDAGLAPTAADEQALDWVAVLDDIGRGTHARVEVPRKRWINPDGTEGDEPPFGGFIHPFLQVAVGRFRAGAEALQPRHEAPLFAGTVELDLVLHLIERLVKHCSGTLILELNVARLRGQLEGDTPEERFRYFAGRHFTPERVVELLREYPVLARLMCVTVERWVATSLEFLGRLAADRGAPGCEVGTLGSVKLGVSDLHRGGRSVVIATDVDGRRVVYKPVSLAVDAAMERLVAGLNALGLRYPLRAPRVLDQGEYGWIEHVQPAGCDRADELRRFYWRQGSLVALLHLTRGADFHHENLLACGEHPVLVDNEALFHHNGWTRGEAATPYEKASAVMGGSVLRQALLPFIFRFTQDGRGVDSSGMGGGGGQVVAKVARRWAAPATDQMRVVAADLVTEQAQNLPTLGGRAASAPDFLAEIVDGFRQTYDLAAAHRAEVGALLDGFAGATVRHLVRATRQYTVFLREGNHPNDLRDGLDRDALLDRLWAQAAADPRYRTLVACEQEDLRTGDVPAFYTRPESADVFGARGERVEDFFRESSLAEAHRILDTLSDEDRDRQILLIRMALSEARDRGGAPEPMRPIVPAADEDALLEAAVRVGEALKLRALGDDRGRYWISLDPFVSDSPGGDRPRNVALARADLYHGSAGIGLFLGYLGEATGRADFTGLARGAMRTVRHAMALEGASANRAVGAFLGRAGYTYALHHLGTLWNDAELIAAALADLPMVEALVEHDREFDVLAGSAGCALVMLELHRSTGDAAALRVARACGEHLLAHARPAGDGVGWAGETFGEPVPGVSHGAAGIAWALFALAAATGDERFRDQAIQALAFERGFLASPEGGRFRARAAWCHGEPSVGLGRAASIPYHQDTRTRAEVEAGGARLLDAGPPTDLSLCHGVLGNAELLAAAGAQLGNDGWRHSAREWAATAAGAVTHGGDPYLHLSERFAGLMCGLAGTGWGLLRFARPHAIPSVLALEAPPPRS